MKRRLLSVIALATLCLLSAQQHAAAFSIFGGVCNGSTGDSAVCKTGTPDKNPLIDTMIAITNIVALVGGMAAIIIILISALRFITSGSDVSTGSRTDTDVEDARRSLASALLGLAVIVLGRTLILFVIGKL